MAGNFLLTKSEIITWATSKTDLSHHLIFNHFAPDIVMPSKYVLELLSHQKFALKSALKVVIFC